MRTAFRNVVAVSLLAGLLGLPAAGSAQGSGAPTPTAAVQAATASVSTLTLLDRLPTRKETRAGYDRDRFRHWTDRDGDGCDTRDEVLLTEAVVRPGTGTSCRLTGGSWLSRYDGVRFGDSSRLDVDHLVPLAEAWQSGAKRWTKGTRRAFANDLRYGRSLIAVSASTNRSKGEREPQDWMPPRRAYHCTYVTSWVAVKWRWRLAVNGPERRYLKQRLTSCGSPRIARPPRADVTIRTDGGGSTAGDGSGGGSTDYVYGVTPGAFCSPLGAYGYTTAGTLMRCKTSATDTRARWRSV